MPYGVGFMRFGGLFCSSTEGISVGRVLFPWVLEIMLSGPRLLLSALALGMCVLGLLWIRRSSLSFVRFVCPLVSVLLFPWVYLHPWGLLAWGGIAGGLVLRRMFCLFFLLLRLAAGS